MLSLLDAQDSKVRQQIHISSLQHAASFVALFLARLEMSKGRLLDSMTPQGALAWK
jgi:hypothetical protein